MRTCLLILIVAVIVSVGSRSALRAGQQAPETRKVADALRPAVPERVGGILGERLDLWRRVRLWRVVNDPFLLDGFTHPPGTHPWQGEHVGKWLHAASLAGDATRDPKLNEKIRAVVAELIAAQENNGYLGTYAPNDRYYAKVATGDPTTWDIWTQRYNIHGLLSYCNLHDDPAAAQACERSAKLLMQTVGPPTGDITRFGTRSGLSAAVMLESVVMLYQQTGDERYLEFARHIVRNIEENAQLRIMAAMRAGEDVTVSGDGKAYQLMAVLLGYVELYRCTGEKEYLDTAVTAWERIRADHVNVAGGPWSYQVKNTTNQECFAPPQYFHPTNCVETCSTTTWIQLCLSLFNLNGEVRFADAAEVSTLNQLIGAQSPNGKDWAYHSMLNMPDRGYDHEITCCASSGPRALELYGRNLMCVANDRLVVNSYVPSVVPLDGGGGLLGRVIVEGRYPFTPECTLRFEVKEPATFAVDFRLPAGVPSMEIAVNGETPELKEEPRRDFVRVHREWKPGDRVALKFDYPLRAHFQTASDGVRYVAFTWGPLALAQSVITQTDQPISVLTVKDESEDGNLWLTRDSAPEGAAPASHNAIEELDTNAAAQTTADAAMPAWRLKTPRKIVLVPYFKAGSKGGGVRTMFPTRTTPL
jgi:uncharacterized protein